jgi:hypothetical protein
MLNLYSDNGSFSDHSWPNIHRHSYHKRYVQDRNILVNIQAYTNFRYSCTQHDLDQNANVHTSFL